MSRELWVNLQAHRESNLLPQFLAQVDELQFVGFLDTDTRLVPQGVTALLYQADTVADARLAYSDAVSHDTLGVWLSQCTERARLDNKCFLKLSEYTYAPWAEVMVDGTTWLLSLWDRLNEHELEVVSGDRCRLLWLHEAEYAYEAFFRAIDHVGQDAMAF